MSVETTPRTSSAPVPHRWRNLFTLTGSTAIDSTEQSAISTIFPTIASALGLNSGHLGIMTAAGKIASAPAGPAWTWLAARTSRKFVLVTTSLAGGAFGVAAGFSHEFWMLLVLNTLMAASLVGGSPVANAFIMDCFEDRRRGQAMSVLYGFAAAIGSFTGPLLGLFTQLDDGWRIGLFTMGVIAITAGLAQWVLIRDPGIGASEPELGDLDQTKRGAERADLTSILSLFRVPTFSIMMVSRMLSGHLLITVFGVTFLVDERGFDNATASLVLVPFGLGYLAGIFGGGALLARLDDVLPHRGRVWYIQAAQVLFAVAALIGTQSEATSIWYYATFWALMGACQGMNPPVNRPIISSVISPHQRGQAMAIFITVFETLAWAAFSLGAGQLAEVLSIEGVFFWVLGVLMIVNALVLGLLHRTYPRDCVRMVGLLNAQRDRAMQRRANTGVDD
ncbi:MFS transporter [Nesterenkonia halophila]|uniref:MFS transporter n=1 Tax=Nesterenkonia halophila TaxID=302044 RepID=UPI001FE3935B|nr:MFS transporter [Nesterenkonia halophila]